MNTKVRGRNSLRPRGAATNLAVPKQTFLAVLPGFLTIALCALSASAWSGIFPSAALVVPTIVSLAAASLVAWFARRQSAVVFLACVLGTVFVVAHLTVLRSLSTAGAAIPSSRSLRGFGDAFRNGWSRILTSPIPMNFGVDRSLVFIVIVVLGSSAGLYFAVRQRALPATMVGPSAIALAARLYGTTTRAPWAALAAAIGAGIALLATLSANSRTARRRPGKALATSTCQTSDAATGPNRAVLGFRGRALIAVALTALLGATIGGVGLAANKKRVGKPYDPRRVAPLQNDDALTIDPLAYIPYWAQNGKQKMFTAQASVKGSTAALPTRWRLAVLDNFDGARWLPNTRYTETGTLLPAPPSGSGIDRNAAAFSVDVSIADLPERWLPVPGWPTELAGTAISIDQEHGVVLRRKPSAPAGQIVAVGTDRELTDQEATDQEEIGEPRTRYRVKAIPLLTQAPSNLGGFADSENARQSLATPKIPADLTNIAQTVASGASSPQERVALLENYLRSFYEFNSVAQPGHSYARIERLLRDQGAQGEGGTSEQFAVTFAILARSLGIPTRVVVGFVKDSDGESPTDIADTATSGNSPEVLEEAVNDPSTITFTAADARAWPEVLFANAGWVPFDPTPRAGSTPREPKPESGGADEVSTSIPDTVPPSAIAEDSEPVIDTSKASKLSPWIWRLLLGTLLVLGAFGLHASIVRKRQADRRRQQGRLAIFGAWHEATRSLAACQQRVGVGDTVYDFAQRAASVERFRTLNEPLTTMALACEKSQFGSTEPTDDEIANAWAASDQVLAGVRAAATPKEKALLLFDLRK
jgi:transglutaminase-like putative cysteine protease